MSSENKIETICSILQEIPFEYDQFENCYQFKVKALAEMFVKKYKNALDELNLDSYEALITVNTLYELTIQQGNDNRKALMILLLSNESSLIEKHKLDNYMKKIFKMTDFHCWTIITAAYSAIKKIREIYGENPDFSNLDIFFI